ncbi:MAG: hypothetical protein JSR87_01600 [Proteobacteria bacterium]|nr:hypothetical protein [Pseudomonadota bacterium]MBS0573947.1 hypothetical protein [Pseudomonadota bacterium]
MVDRNMQDFRGRLGRIGRIHRKGGGFEADGALGMAYYNAKRHPRRRPRLLFLLLFLAVALVGLKAGLMATIGPDAYGARLATLRQGTELDRLGAWVLTADPVTVTLAGQIRRHLN